MNRFLTTVLLSWTISFLGAQTTTTFESFGLEAGNFINDASPADAFQAGNLSLPNEFFGTYWSGWVISSATDTQTPGVGNQYSAITGGGVDGSDTYALTYEFGGSIIRLENEAAGGVVEGLYVTNSTYAYFSMLEGDDFAKRFGGETGEDPDYFSLRIRAFYNGNLSTDSVEFFLADYRFADPADDYIVDDWTYLDLSGLGNVDSLLFKLYSSDSNEFGPNTPAYFCLDNVTTRDMPVATDEPLHPWSIDVYPNPVAENLMLHWPSSHEGQGALFNLQGQQVASFTLRPGDQSISLRHLAPGSYVLFYWTSAGWSSERIVKL